MSGNHVSITFTRNLADDLDVVGCAGETPDVEALKAQFLAEFEEFLSENPLSISRLELMSPEYKIEASYSLHDGVNLTPLDALDKVRAELQSAYDHESAAGHFDIGSVAIGGDVYQSEVLLAMRPGPAAARRM